MGTHECNNEICEKLVERTITANSYIGDILIGEGIISRKEDIMRIKKPEELSCIEGNTKNLNEMVEKLVNRKLTNIDSQISKINSILNNHDLEIKALKENVSKIGEELIAVKSNITTIQGDINTVKDKVNNIESTLNTNHSELKNILLNIKKNNIQ